MFEVGQDVFSSRKGWGKVAFVHPQGKYPVVVDSEDSKGDTYTLEGVSWHSNKYPELFGSFDAMIEYFKKNAPPKPKVKVKKTMEIYVNIYKDNKSDLLLPGVYPKLTKEDSINKADYDAIIKGVKFASEPFEIEE
jgi:hypothetical protein